MWNSIHTEGVVHLQRLLDIDKHVYKEMTVFATGQQLLCMMCHDMPEFRDLSFLWPLLHCYEYFQCWCEPRVMQSAERSLRNREGCEFFLRSGAFHVLLVRPPLCFVCFLADTAVLLALAEIKRKKKQTKKMLSTRVCILFCTLSTRALPHTHATWSYTHAMRTMSSVKREHAHCTCKNRDA